MQKLHDESAITRFCSLRPTDQRLSIEPFNQKPQTEQAKKKPSQIS